MSYFQDDFEIKQGKSNYILFGSGKPHFDCSPLNRAAGDLYFTTHANSNRTQPFNYDRRISLNTYFGPGLFRDCSQFTILSIA